MAGVNKVILVGRLGKDPETRRLANGDPVVSFSLATSETWRDRQSGERKERTEWHNVVIFNDNLAKIAEQYLKKGSECYVEGQIQTRKWQDKEGRDRLTTEIVLQKFRGEITLLGGRRDSQSDDPGIEDRSTGGDFGRSSPMERKPAAVSGGRHADLDDDIPF